MTLKSENHIPGQILTLQLSLFSSKTLDLGGPTSAVSTLLSFCVGVSSTVILLLPPDSHLAFSPLLEYLHLKMPSITQIQENERRFVYTCCLSRMFPLLRACCSLQVPSVLPLCLSWVFPVPTLLWCLQSGFSPHFATRSLLAKVTRAFFIFVFSDLFEDIKANLLEVGNLIKNHGSQICLLCWCAQLSMTLSLQAREKLDLTLPLLANPQGRKVVSHWRLLCLKTCFTNSGLLQFLFFFFLSMKLVILVSNSLNYQISSDN